LLHDKKIIKTIIIRIIIVLRIFILILLLNLNIKLHKKNNLMDIAALKSKIFTVNSFRDFNDIALQIFHYQYQHNAIYGRFIDLLPVNISEISSCYNIPCLPVEFFKSHEIRSVNTPPELIFKSSGTGTGERSNNLVFSKDLYEKSILKSFSLFFGSPEDYILLALVPDYQIARDSSLAFMLDLLIKTSGRKESGFYLNRHDELKEILKKTSGKKKILFGITYALMDLAEQNKLDLKDTVIIETGGMKGRRKEITREELHCVLRQKLGVVDIYSEYSMCELMSQAYSESGGHFITPPWMKIYTREFNDPFSQADNEKKGGINIIDLANLYTCSFLSTKDVGVLHENGSFEVFGRFDNSDIRGCSLLA